MVNKVEKIKSFIADQPLLIPAAITAAAVILIAAVVTLIVLLMKRRNKAQPFEEIVIDTHEEPPVTFRPVLMREDPEDVTKRLFDPKEEFSLNSYCLELVNVDCPEQVFRVAIADRIVVGRRSGCTVPIPNSTLSGEHCEINLRNGRLYIRDLNSLNGTYLNESPERMTSEQELLSGSLVTMGQVKLLVSVGKIG